MTRRRSTGRTAALLTAAVVGGGYLLARRRDRRPAPAGARPVPKTKQAMRAEQAARVQRVVRAERAVQARRDELARRAETPLAGFGESFSRWEMTATFLAMLVPVVAAAELHAPLWGAVDSLYCTPAGCLVVPLVLVGWLLAVPLFGCFLLAVTGVLSRRTGVWTGLLGLTISSAMYGLFLTPVETDSAETIAVGGTLWVLPLAYFVTGFLLLPVYGLAAVTVRHGRSPEHIAERRAVAFACYQFALLLITIALVVI